MKTTENEQQKTTEIPADIPSIPQWIKLLRRATSPVTGDAGHAVTWRFRIVHSTYQISRY